MKPREIVDKLLENDEPSPEELVQASITGRDGLENHLRTHYKDPSLKVSMTAPPYLFVSAREGLNIGGSVYSVVATWLRRQGLDLPIKTFGPAGQYGVQPPIGTDTYIFELYREAVQYLTP